MKTITLTMLQTVRLALMLDAHQGQRKELRIVRELRERLPITDDELQKLLIPIAGGAQISDDVLKKPPIDLAIVPEEARRILAILDAQTITARDLAWCEPLAKQLEAITA